MIDKYQPHSFDCITLLIISHVVPGKPPEAAYNPIAVITIPMIMPITPLYYHACFWQAFSPLRTSLIAAVKHKRFEVACSLTSKRKRGRFVLEAA